MRAYAAASRIETCPSAPDTITRLLQLEPWSRAHPPWRPRVSYVCPVCTALSTPAPVSVYCSLSTLVCTLLPCVLLYPRRHAR